VVTGVPSGGLIQTPLSWIVPALMFYLVWVFLGRRLADRQGFGGLMSIGKSRACVYVEKDTKVTFADVAGVEEAKFELQQVVSLLKAAKPKPWSAWRLQDRIAQVQCGFVRSKCLSENDILTWRGCG
jgi:hypothetical protein